MGVRGPQLVLEQGEAILQELVLLLQLREQPVQLLVIVAKGTRPILKLILLLGQSGLFLLIAVYLALQDEGVLSEAGKNKSEQRQDGDHGKRRTATLSWLTPCNGNALLLKRTSSPTAPSGANGSVTGGGRQVQFIAE